MGDGTGRFDGHGGLRADGHVEFAVRPLVPVTRLAPHGLDRDQRDPQTEPDAAPDVQRVRGQQLRVDHGVCVRANNDEDVQTSASPRPSPVSRRIRARATACRRVRSRPYRR